MGETMEEAIGNAPGQHLLVAALQAIFLFDFWWHRVINEGTGRQILVHIHDIGFGVVNPFYGVIISPKEMPVQRGLPIGLDLGVGHKHGCFKLDTVSRIGIKL